MPVLSQEYESTYKKLLELASTKANVGEPLTAFWPMRGHTYDHKIMIVGRAVNRWPPEAHGQELPDRNFYAGTTDVAEVSKWARMLSESPSNDLRPMDWVEHYANNKKEKYNTNRSAFWRVARTLVNQRNPTSLCWSNLYKVAPSKGGNPRRSLCKQMLALSAEILALEVSEVKPRNIVVLAGREWFRPFAERLGITMPRRDGFVEGVGDADGRRWILAPHPQGKREDLMSAAIHAAIDEG
jgi:hypothetical protein